MVSSDGGNRPSLIDSKEILLLIFSARWWFLWSNQSRTPSRRRCHRFGAWHHRCIPSQQLVDHESLAQSSGCLSISKINVERHPRPQLIRWNESMWLELFSTQPKSVPFEKSIFNPITYWNKPFYMQFEWCFQCNYLFPKNCRQQSDKPSLTGKQGEWERP